MKHNESQLPNFLDERKGELPFLVMQHFNGSDLLKVSEVSKKWNHLVGIYTQRENGDKLRLAINETFKSQFTPDIIQSDRRYKSIRVLRVWETCAEVLQLLLDSAESFTDIHTCYDIDMNDTQLTGVETLSLSLQTFYEYGLLGSVQNLTKLVIDGKSEFPHKIIDCLASNPKLEELVLESGAASKVFSYNMNKIPFSLKILKMSVKFNGGNLETNLMTFLSQQVGTIEEIKLLDCSFNLLCKIMKLLPKLQRLTYSPLQLDQSFSNQPLINIFGLMIRFPNIVEINLIYPCMNILKNLLLVTPNLETLYVSGLNQQTLRVIEFSSKSIYTVRYAYLERNVTIGDILTLYEEDKQSFADVNSHLTFSQI